VELEDVSVTFIPGTDRMTASAAASAAITAYFALQLGPRSRSWPVVETAPLEARQGTTLLLASPT
jgi:hypothetical protein